MVSAAELTFMNRMKNRLRMSSMHVMANIDIADMLLFLPN